MELYYVLIYIPTRIHLQIDQKSGNIKKNVINVKYTKQNKYGEEMTIRKIITLK